MPNGNGLELMRTFYNLLPSGRILAISGGGQHLPAGQCMKIASRFGAHAVLGKPFNREQLFAAITVAMQAAELHPGESSVIAKIESVPSS